MPRACGISSTPTATGATSSRSRGASGRGAAAEALVEHLLNHAAHAAPRGFGVDPNRTAPRLVTRAGTQCIEALFRFETATGHRQRRVATSPEYCPRTQGVDAAHRAGRAERPRGAHRATPADRDSRIPATSAGRTGSTCARPRRPTQTASRRCWWWAADRPDFRSVRASRSAASIRSSSTAGRGSATTGASATTRSRCTTRCT